MIRINLMPNKKIVRRKGEVGADAGGGESQAWLIFVLGAVLLEVIVLLFVYKTKQDQLRDVLRRAAQGGRDHERGERDLQQELEAVPVAELSPQGRGGGGGGTPPT